MKTRFPIVLGAALLAAGPASAHALLRSAMPAANSTVTAAPPALKLVFSEALEPRFSQIVVTSEGGARVDEDDLKAAPGNGRTVTVDLQPLKPGKYLVTWQATSVDTHKTHGTFSFTVAP